MSTHISTPSHYNTLKVLTFGAIPNSILLVSSMLMIIIGTLLGVELRHLKGEFGGDMDDYVNGFARYVLNPSVLNSLCDIAKLA